MTNNNNKSTSTELRERRSRSPTPTASGDSNNPSSPNKKNMGVHKDDRLSIAILLVLYTLQGIPMGLCGSIPLILKEKGVSYESLSLFSLVSLPFSLKLLWAPVVDSFYFKSFGRRKSWLVPVQILTGLIMLFVGSAYIDQWVGEVSSPTGTKLAPDVNTLTIYFLFLYFLMSTQDIAVDGWALTMLSRINVGYGSVCNSIGQSLGIFLANQGFIALSDDEWCHKFLGISKGHHLISLGGFMRFWGYVFIVTTVIIWLFKDEENVRSIFSFSRFKIWGDRPSNKDDIAKYKDSDSEEANESADLPGITETCSQIISIFRLKPVQTLAFILLTFKIAFAPVDAVSNFKLQEYGMPKADIAMISPLLLITGLLLPALTSKSVTSTPLDLVVIAIPLKLVTSAGIWLAAQWTIDAYANGSVPGYSFFLPLVCLMLLNEIAGTLIFISLMSFFSKVSDPTIGGSYMTLLNTLTNLGGKWSTSLSLWLLPKMTFTACEVVNNEGHWSRLSNIVCSEKSLTSCNEAGGTCNIQIDGYTIQTFACLVLGFLWMLMYKKTLADLQQLPHSAWMIQKSQ